MKKKRSICEVALEIFLEKGSPIHYKELTKMLLDKCALTGNTPHESVRSRIGTDERFKRVAEGVYALTEWDEYPVARFAKEIAYDILITVEEPLPMLQLGEEILAERKFAGGPGQVARNAIRTDERFYLDQEKGLVGLVEWRKK